ADTLGRYYNYAPTLIERNNHGHAVVSWFKEHSRLRLLTGYDSKPGWLSNTLGKSLLYNELADCFRDRAATVHNYDTYIQLASIDGNTLSAPEGFMDDRADAFALAHMARVLLTTSGIAMRQANVAGRRRRPMMRRAVRRVV